MAPRRLLALRRLHLRHPRARRRRLEDRRPAASCEPRGAGRGGRWPLEVARRAAGRGRRHLRRALQRAGRAAHRAGELGGVVRWFGGSERGVGDA